MKARYCPNCGLKADEDETIRIVYNYKGDQLQLCELCGLFFYEIELEGDTNALCNSKILSDKS